MIDNQWTNAGKTSTCTLYIQTAGRSRRSKRGKHVLVQTSDRYDNVDRIVAYVLP